MAPRSRVRYVYITIASDNSSIARLPPEIWRFHVWRYLNRGSFDAAGSTCVSLRDHCETALKSQLPIWLRKSKRSQYKTRFASLACSPDGQYLAAGTDVGSIVVWSTRTGEKLFEQTPPPAGAIRAMAWSADSASIRFVAKGCRRLVSGVLDLETKTINYDSFGRVRGDVASLALSSDGTYVAVSGYCGTYMLLRLARDSTHVIYQDVSSNQAVKAMSFLPDGLNLIFSTDGGATRLRRANSTLAEPICRVPDRFGLANFLPSSLAVSPDGTHVAVGGHGGSLILQHARENKVVRSFAVPVNATVPNHCVITSLAFSPNGRHLFCAATYGDVNSRSSTVYMFQVSSGALLYVF